MTDQIRVLCFLTGCLAMEMAIVASPTTVKKQADAWVLENDQLQVALETKPGSITVHDKGSGTTWRQPGTTATGVTFRRVSKPPTIDGDLSEWEGESTAKLASPMTTFGKVANDPDCSAEVWCGWDASHLYLAARVKDEVLTFGPSPSTSWWEREAVEVWVGGAQMGLSLNPDHSHAMGATGFPKSEELPDSQVIVKPATGGYIVEAALPWASIPLAPKPELGTRFPFAVGVDDADGTGSPDGQIYFPSHWVHSNTATFSEATLADEAGMLPAPPIPPEPKFRNTKELTNGAKGIAFEADFGPAKGKRYTLTVSLTLPDGTSDLVIEADMSDRNAQVPELDFLAPFLLDAAGSVLALADSGNGHLYPLDLKPFPQSSFRAGRLLMPWVGVCNLEKGFGYALIFETSDDAVVICGQHFSQGRQVAAPHVAWTPSKGRFAYPRRVLYRFVPSGGYVALAKAYRAYAKENGLIVPLAEKLKKNPNIARLFGAVDVWGDASLSFVRKAKAAGVEKMLLHGGSTPEAIKAANDAGYLSSDCDSYTDVLPLDGGQALDATHDRLPENAALRSDRQPLSGWLSWDRKIQYTKRCPALWTPTAKVVLPKLLAELPFLGRCMDGITAEGLYECHDEKHPVTKAEKRQYGVNLLDYDRSQNLVVGAEQGAWWAVPLLDYVEGAMSGGYGSWPMGHLIHPATKANTFNSPWGGRLGTWADYEKWGMGHEWRVPLWELVFHDCVVSTWHRGDSNDWLLAAAPEMTAKKDAFNILYGTIPLLWANQEGSWHTARETFLRAYNNTCGLHKAIAGAEMLTHEFVTPDRAVQRTRFSDSTVVVVNFGEQPFSAEVDGRVFLLPQNGFAAKGPRIEQSLSLVDGKPVTVVKEEGW